MKKCLYCGKPIDDNSVLEVCDKCGFGTFGGNMLGAIKKNMQDADKRGDLFQGE